MRTLNMHQPKTTTLTASGALAGTALQQITITEVVGMLPVAAMLPGTGSVFGLISFRGKTMPVIDLRMDTITLASTEEQICILAAETRQQDPIFFGALVDSEAAAYELVLSTTH